jgi:hypothetical protein
MKNLILLSAFLLSTSINALPPCPAGTWNNCFGTYTSPSGEKYVGEFKDNKRHGQGTNTWPSGEKYVGQYKDGKRHGLGTYFWANGERDAGYYLGGEYVPDICEDMGLRKGTDKFGDCVLMLIEKI